jgi:hypothetical protein
MTAHPHPASWLDTNTPLDHRLGHLVHDVLTALWGKEYERVNAWLSTPIEEFTMQACLIRLTSRYEALLPAWQSAIDRATLVMDADIYLGGMLHSTK